MIISAIVLAYGAEPHLVDCVAALAHSSVPVEIIVVNNVADPTQVAKAAGHGVRLLDPGRNLGFAGGANLGAAAATGDVLVFVNSDAVVAPDAVAVLAERVRNPSVGLASASVRLASDPDLLNTSGNPVNFLMFSWAGNLGEPAHAHDRAVAVASISGATFAVRRQVWDELGGFDEEYFAYCEDVDLSLRAWRSGYQVMFEPAAVVTHHYEFSRTPTKHYLLERNRLVNLLTIPDRRTRRLVAPAALAVEVGVAIVAARDGWLADKVAGWRWLLANREYLRARRARSRPPGSLPDAELAAVLRGRLDPPAGLGPAVPDLVNDALDWYWRKVRTRL